MVDVSVSRINQPGLPSSSFAGSFDPVNPDGPRVRSGTALDGWEVDAVARISGEIVIERLIEDVFDFVADERNEPLSNPALLHSDKITDGPVGIGTRFRATHKSTRRPVDMEVEITEYDRPRRMASRITMSWSDIEGQLAFAAVGCSTNMLWNWEVRPKGAATLIRPLVGVIGRRSERAG